MSSQKARIKADDSTYMFVITLASADFRVQHSKIVCKYTNFPGIMQKNEQLFVVPFQSNVQAGHRWWQELWTEQKAETTMASA